MNMLFPAKIQLPLGFRYTPAFLSHEEEDRLLTAIRSISLHTFLFQGFEAKRKVASFGFDYSFDTRTLKKGEPIPDQFKPLVSKVGRELLLTEGDIAELLVTEYPPGSVINWHRDAPPFKIIAGVSLSEPCMFKFRPHDKARQNRKSIISLPVEPRSLYVMEGEARSHWQHSIAPVKNIRYSITLRTVL